MSHRPTGTDKAEIILAIHTSSVRGIGTSEDPVRPIEQYWTLDGRMIAEHDCFMDSVDDVNEPQGAF